MKKYLLGLILLGSMSLSSVAYADANFWHIFWNNGDDDSTIANVYAGNAGYEFLVKNPTSKQPEFWKTDSTLFWNAASSTLKVGTIPQSSVANLVSDMNIIFGTVDSVAEEENFIRLDYKTQRLRTQTDSSGLYYWEFPEPYPGGTIPVVTVTAEDALPTDVRIIAVDEWSVTVQASRGTTTPQTYVHIIAGRHQD